MALACVTFAPLSANAAWLPDGTPMVGGSSSANVYFWSRSLIPDGTGGFFMVWDDGQDNQSDVRAQRVSGNGDLLWASNGVSACSAAGSQGGSDLTSDATGGIFIAWVDHRSDVADIYAQRITATGAIATGWPTDGVAVATGPAYQSKFDLTADGSGGLFVAWEDATLDDGNLVGDALVRLQHLDANGQVASGWPADGLVVVNALATESFPSIAPDGAGGVVVAWQDGRSGGGPQIDVYAQRIAGDGTLLWPSTGRPVCIAPGRQTAPQILEGGDGTFFVVWGDQRLEDDIYAQRLTLDGDLAPGWTADGRPVTTAAGSQSAPFLELDRAGGIFVVWTQDLRNGASNGDVYLQRLNGDGSVAAGWQPDGTPACTAPGDQYGSKFVVTDDGSVVLAWVDYRSFAQLDIYAQRILPSGVPGPGWPTNGLAICAASGHQQSPHVVVVDPSHVVVAWNDFRVPDGDVYAQRVSIGDGAIGDQAPAVVAPVTVSGIEGEAVQFTVTASDPDDDPILSLTADPLPDGATFTIVEGNTSGVFVWTPGYDNAGSYTVSFQASNALIASASTQILVSTAFTIASAHFDSATYRPGNHAVGGIRIVNHQAVPAMVDVRTIILEGMPPLAIARDSSSVLGVVLQAQDTTDVQVSYIVPSLIAGSVSAFQFSVWIFDSTGTEADSLLRPGFTVSSVSADASQNQEARLSACASAVPPSDKWYSLYSCIAFAVSVGLPNSDLVSDLVWSGLSAETAILNSECAAAAYSQTDECRSLVSHIMAGVSIIGWASKWLGSLAFLSGVGSSAAPALLAAGTVVSGAECYLENLSFSLGKNSPADLICDLGASTLTQQAARVVGDGSMIHPLLDLTPSVTDSIGMPFRAHVAAEGPIRLRLTLPIGTTTVESTSVAEVVGITLLPDTLQWFAVGTTAHRIGLSPTSVPSPPDSIFPLDINGVASSEGYVSLGVIVRTGNLFTQQEVFYDSIHVLAGTRITAHVGGGDPLFVDRDGDGTWDEIRYPGGGIVGVSDEVSGSIGPSFDGVSPNPISTATVLRFSLLTTMVVSARVFDVQGRFVSSIVDSKLSAGRYERSWDGRDASGRTVSSGVYYYVFRAGQMRRTGRIVILR